MLGCKGIISITTLTHWLNYFSLPDHLNLCQSLPFDVQPPVCQAQLPTVIYSYDHLEGVKHRHLLNSTAEPMLLTTMSSYFKTAEELGGQVSLALEKVSMILY